MNQLFKAIQDHFQFDWPEAKLLNCLIQFLIEKQWYHVPRNATLYKSVLLGEGYAVNVDAMIDFLSSMDFQYESIS